MILPNPALAIIDEDKLSGYSLNTEHSEGKHKARVFKSVLKMILHYQPKELAIA